MEKKRGQSGSRRSGRSKSSERWLARQRRDPFARKAVLEGKGSRAHYKLEQLDARFRLFKAGMRVLELGAAPGGWTRYVEERIQPRGLLIAVDYREVAASGDTVVIEGSLGEPETDQAIAAALNGRPVDLVLSDMAPNISGIRTADQARTMELVEMSVAAAGDWLKPGGSLVAKVFQGDGIDQWVRDMRKIFDSFRLVKPEASRPDSREVYAVAQGFRSTEA